VHGHDRDQADDWDTQMLFFLLHGYRVIAQPARAPRRSLARGRPLIIKWCT
jgi:hypothetical protein